MDFSVHNTRKVVGLVFCKVKIENFAKELLGKAILLIGFAISAKFKSKHVNFSNTVLVAWF